jgi:clan AA aspartic protease (TIGR02281 family)
MREPRTFLLISKAIKRARRRGALAGAAIVLAAAVAAPAAAQTQQQIDWCVDKDHMFSFDQRIGGCTALVQSGRVNHDQLSTARNNRGTAYAEKGDLDRAINDFNEAIRLDPNDARWYNNRGGAYLAKQDFVRAIADYNEAIRLDPTYAVALHNRGFAYQSKQDFDRAIADYNEAIRLDPNDARWYHGRGNSYQSKQDFDRAIADYNEAIRLDPTFADALNNRGAVYRIKGNLGRALADYNEAIRLDPKNSLAFSNRGLAYQAKPDLDRAVADCNEAIRLDPGNTAAFTGCGLAYEAKGDRERARASFNVALAMAPKYSNGQWAQDTARQHLAALGQATAPAPAVATGERVPMKMDGGIFVVPVEINGVMTLNFGVDSGASDVSVPADVFSTLMRAGTIREADLSGRQTYVLADGSKSQSTTFTIRSLRLGNIVVENVRASVAPSRGSLLLGQSFFQRFKSWSIDNAKQELHLEAR